MAPGKPNPELLRELRHLLVEDERLGAVAGLSFGVVEIDAHLGRHGLLTAALHEIMPALVCHTLAAFAFVAALLSRLSSSGPIIFINSPHGLAGHGRPSGHGLNGFGLDPGRLLLVEARDEKQALWAFEESLRSGVPVAVAGAIGKTLDFKTSQRLHFGARKSGIPLLLMPPRAGEPSAAATRWRISAIPAARDRFGLVLKSRWKVRLDRCRNGRPGEWLVEWDHATHRFSLAAALAGSALSDTAEPPQGLAVSHRS